MSIVLATAWADGGSPADDVAALAAPLLAEGAVLAATAQQAGAAVGCLRWAGAARPAELHEADDLILALDGYTIGPARCASELADIYRQGSLASLEALDGSFVMAVVEPARRVVHVLTDRGGSRPVFVAHEGGRLHAAPQLRCFIRTGIGPDDLDPAAVLSLLLNAYMLGETTYLPSVRCLGPARRATLRERRLTLERYWEPRFGQTTPRSPADADAAIVRSVAEHLQRFQRPVIGLSGGVDSRLMLAAARAAGIAVQTVTWTYAHEDTEESDLAVASRVASAAGVPHRAHRLKWDTLADDAPALVRAADGLVGHLGGLADRQRLAAELAREHDALFLGDQCYRGESEVSSADHALEGIGISTLPGPMRRLARFLMQPDAAERAMQAYDAAVRKLTPDELREMAPQDLHDRLYWAVRLPRLLTGPKALWRRYLDAVSPMLAAPVLELAAGLPGEQRVHKQYLRDAVARLAPDFAAIPYARRSGRVKWRRVLREQGRFQEYLGRTLLSPDPCFDRWFDRASLRLACRSALGAAPAGSGSGGLRRVVRSLLVRPMLRPPLLLGLLTLRLWMGAWRPADPD